MSDNVTPIVNRALHHVQREIDAVVADLRKLRVASLESRHRRDRHSNCQGHGTRHAHFCAHTTYSQIA